MDVRIIVETGLEAPTLFGRVHIKVPRIRRCACNAKSEVTLIAWRERPNAPI